MTGDPMALEELHPRLRIVRGENGNGRFEKTYDKNNVLIKVIQIVRQFGVVGGTAVDLPFPTDFPDVNYVTATSTQNQNRNVQANSLSMTVSAIQVVTRNAATGAFFGAAIDMTATWLIGVQ